MGFAELRAWSRALREQAQEAVFESRALRAMVRIAAEARPTSPVPDQVANSRRRGR